MNLEDELELIKIQIADLPKEDRLEAYFLHSMNMMVKIAQQMGRDGDAIDRLFIAQKAHLDGFHLK